MPLLPELVTHNLWLKLAALGLAVLLWGVLRADAPGFATYDAVPVDVVVDDPGWTLAAPPDPQTVQVAFSGTARELLRLVGVQPRVVVTIDEVTDSTMTRDLVGGMVRVDAGGDRPTVARVTPTRVSLSFEPVQSALRPVAIRVRGSLPPGVRLARTITAQPGSVRVSGALSRLATLDSVPLEPVDISTLTAPATLQVHVDTAAMRGFLVSPRRVAVTVEAITVPDSTLLPDTATPDTAAVDTIGARARPPRPPRRR